MVKKQSFFSKIGIGFKKTGKFLEHEKEAFEGWKKEHRAKSIKSHQTKLKEQRKHYKEEFDTLSEQRALEQLRTEVDVQKQEHRTSVAQLRAQRRELRATSRGAGVGGTLMEIFLPSKKQIAIEKESSLAQGTGGALSQYRAENKAILAQIDAKAKKR